MNIILIIFLIAMLTVVLRVVWYLVKLLKVVWPHKAILLSYYIGRAIHPSCACCDTCVSFIKQTETIKEGECIEKRLIYKTNSLCYKWKSRIAQTEVERILSKGW